MKPAAICSTALGELLPLGCNLGFLRLCGGQLIDHLVEVLATIHQGPIELLRRKLEAGIEAGKPRLQIPVGLLHRRQRGLAPSPCKIGQSTVPVSLDQIRISAMAMSKQRTAA